MRVTLPESFRACSLETPHADLDALADLAREASRSTRHLPPRMLEVGSWAGRTALALNQGAPESALYCVDTWQGTATDVTGAKCQEWGPDFVYGCFCLNMGWKLLRQVVPLRGTSRFWATHLPFNKGLDLVFLDGDHDYRAVKDDIALWTPHLRPGGILCGHDLTDDFPGVRRAVEESGPYERAGACLWFRRMPGGEHS
jgi:SAM-dependent methyltransferase